MRPKPLEPTCLPTREGILYLEMVDVDENRGCKRGGSCYEFEFVSEAQVRLKVF